jgi:hypothetical protein
MKLKTILLLAQLLVIISIAQTQTLMQGLPIDQIKKRQMNSMIGINDEINSDTIWLRGKEEMFLYENGQFVPFEFYNIIEYYDHIPDYYKLKNWYMIDTETNDSLTFVHYSYDSLNRLTHEIWRDYDTLSNVWIDIAQTFHHYDLNGNDTNWMSQLWDTEQGLWINNYRSFRRIHEIIGAYTEDYYEQWNGTEWKIIQGQKFEYFLSDCNCTDSINIIRWNNNIQNWEIKHKWYLYYDENNVQTLGIDIIFDSQLQAWRNYQRTLDYEFHSWPGCDKMWLFESNSSHFIIQNWYDSSWINIERYNATYDEIGGKIAFLESFNGDEWINGSRNENIYQIINGNIEQDYNLLSFWDGNNYRGAIGSKYEYTFEEGKLIELFNYEWDSTINDWTQKRWFKYSNYKLFLNTEENQFLNSDTNKLKIYPNPGKEEMFIELVDQDELISEINIYNNTGQCIYNRSYNNKGIKKEKVKISHLSKGVYVVQTKSSNKKFYTGKLVKD